MVEKYFRQSHTEWIQANQEWCKANGVKQPLQKKHVELWCHATTAAAAGAIKSDGYVLPCTSTSFKHDGKLASDVFAPPGLWFTACSKDGKPPETTSYPDRGGYKHAAQLRASVTELLRGGFEAGEGQRSWRLFFITIEKMRRYHIQYALVLEGTPEYFWFQNNKTEINRGAKESDGGFFELQIKRRNEDSEDTVISDSFVKLTCTKGEHKFFAIDLGEGEGTTQVDTSVCFIPPDGRRVLVRAPMFPEETTVKVSESGLPEAAVGRLEVCSAQLNRANTLTSHLLCARAGQTRQGQRGQGEGGRKRLPAGEWARCQCLARLSLHGVRP